MLLKCIDFFIQVDFGPDLLQRPLFKEKSVQDEIFDFFAHMLLLRSSTFDVLSLKLRQFL